MNRESCIQTIELLRKLALNIHGIIDVIDDRNCNDIITMLKEQEAVEPLKQTEQTEWTVCGNCHKHIISKWTFCPHCGRSVKWDA